MLACVIVMTSVFACEHECVSSACGPDMCIHVAMFVGVRDVGYCYSGHCFPCNVS